MLDLVPLTTEKESKKSIFYDASLSVPKPDRQRRPLTFLEAGSIVKKANKLRAKVAKEGEQKDIEGLDIHKKEEVIKKQKN